VPERVGARVVPALKEGRQLSLVHVDAVVVVGVGYSCYLRVPLFSPMPRWLRYGELSSSLLLYSPLSICLLCLETDIRAMMMELFARLFVSATLVCSVGMFNRVTSVNTEQRNLLIWTVRESLGSAWPRQHAEPGRILGLKAVRAVAHRRNPRDV